MTLSNGDTCLPKLGSYAAVLWLAALPILSPAPLAAQPVTIPVVVHFTQPLTLAGVTEADLVTKLTIDLDLEFASEAITFSVQQTATNYAAQAQTAIAGIDVASGYAAARVQMDQLLTTDPDALNYSDPAAFPPATAAVVQSVASTSTTFQQSVDASLNLGAVPAGVIAFVLTPSTDPGGDTKGGERWSKIRWGALPKIFPTPAELGAGAQGVDIDFTASNFDPYRATYTDLVRAQYMLQSLANVAKHELGRMLGISVTTGPLDDAMRGAVQLATAEHFARDAAPTHYSLTARTALAAALRAL